MEVQDASVFCIDFGIDVCEIWAQVGAMLALSAHKTHPRPTKTPTNVIQNAQDGPRRVPDPSRTPPDLDFGAPELQFSNDFESSFGYFRTLIFQYFFIVCSSFSSKIWNGNYVKVKDL